MTQSTVEPDTVKLWRVIGGQLDVTVAWNAHEVTVADEMNGDRQEWEYESLRFCVPYDGPEELARQYVTASEGLILALAKARAGEIVSSDVDRTTEAAINAQINATTPTGEQLAILRDQLVQILNVLGLEPTADFVRLNEIAIAEIEKAQIEKEALDA